MTKTHKMTKLYCLRTLLFFILVSSVLCQKVSVSVYYETLNPDSSSFITDELHDFYGGPTFVADLHMVPWGKAKLQDNNTYECENGPDECLLNTIEACAINVWPVFIPITFITCMQLLVDKGLYTKWEDCFNLRGIDRKPVDWCYGGGLGKEDYKNYLTYICNAYKGPPMPPCNGSSSGDVIKMNTRTPASCID